jgi:uncharacterized repeat protein (TIGR02543 family)
MKKTLILCAAFIIIASALSAFGVTLTLNANYPGAPAPKTVATDGQGCLTGAPLPVPKRPGYTFRGWFTTSAATGGSQVIAGAAGTMFSQNAEIYARWVDAAPVNMNNMPRNMRENFDWLKNDRYPREPYMPLAVPGWNSWYNTLFDQIWDGNGSINYGVRWESTKSITFEERKQIASMLHEAVNSWMRVIIGMEGWPFQEISVKISGWAVSDGAKILDKRPNEAVWVNNTYDDPGPASADHPRNLIASAPKAMTRVNNLNAIKNDMNYQYGGDPYARVDLYLWCTEYDFGAAGHGSWWGQRLPSADVIKAAKSGGAGSGVMLHEIGHGFGLYDFYGAVGVDKPPTTSTGGVFGQGDLKGVMWNGTGAKTINEYDTWQIRYWWDWIRTATPANANRFRPPPNDDGSATPVANRAPIVAKNGSTAFRFDNRGTLRYNLGGERTAILKIFDSRGKSVRTMRLYGTQTTVNTNLKTASQTLIWRAETASGKVIDQGKTRFISR